LRKSVAAFCRCLGSRRSGCCGASTWLTLLLLLLLRLTWNERQIDDAVVELDHVARMDEVMQIPGKRRLLLKHLRGVMILTEDLCSQVATGAPRRSLDRLDDGGYVLR